MEHIRYRGWRIDFTPLRPGWRAAIYRSGALMPELLMPHSLRDDDRTRVIDEAKAYIDGHTG